MNTITRKDWIDALRSGKYKQSAGQLISVEEDGTECLCTLGVACEISGLPRTDSYWGWNVTTRKESVEESPDVLYYGEGILPQVVADMVGSTHEEQSEIWRLNDVNLLSFKEMADWLEARTA